MKIDKYKALLGQNFGFLTLVKIEQVGLASNPKRFKHVLHFVCSCGVEKQFSGSNASAIFKGTTTSCGCRRKEQWRKAYYSWKKDWDKKVPNEVPETR